jgi:hypothetical protein
LDMCRTENRDSERKNVELQRERQQGMITIYSCDRGQSSYEISDFKQGAFTHALLEGLRTKTTLRDLAMYLESRVPALHTSVGKADRRQTPRVIPDPGWKFDKSVLFPYIVQTDLAELQGRTIELRYDACLTSNLLKLDIRKIVRQGIHSVEFLGKQVLRISNGIQNLPEVAKFLQSHADFPWLIVCIFGICYLPIGLITGFATKEIWVLVIPLIAVCTGAALAIVGISSAQVEDWSYQKDSSFFVTLGLAIIWAGGGVIAGSFAAHFYPSCTSWVWSWAVLWFLSIGTIHDETSLAWSWLAISLTPIIGVLVGLSLGIGIMSGIIWAILALFQFFGIIGMLFLPKILSSTKKKRKNYHTISVCFLSPILGLIIGKLISVWMNPS